MRRLVLFLWRPFTSLVGWEKCVGTLQVKCLLNEQLEVSQSGVDLSRIGNGVIPHP